jgi:hypothetical protein
MCAQRVLCDNFKVAGFPAMYFGPVSAFIARDLNKLKRYDYKRYNGQTSATTMAWLKELLGYVPRAGATCQHCVVGCSGLHGLPWRS